MSPDVAILYRIITSAERHPCADTLPFRAIFAAYDEVLAQNGIDPNHDQIYLRFLFRLGDNKRPNLSLHENFEALLAELGILVEIDEDGVKSHEATEHIPLEGQPQIETETSMRQHSSSNRPRHRSGRSPLNYLYEDGNEGTRAILYRPRSRASMSQLQPAEETREVRRPSTRATTRPTEKTRAQSLQGHSSSVRNRLTTESLDNQPQSRNRRGAPTLHDSPDSTDVGAEAGGYHQLHEAQRAAQVTINPQATYVVDQLALLYRPSETQLLRDAETFAHYRIQHVARGVLEKWCGLAFRAQKKHDSMAARASKYDIRDLLSQSFSQWRRRCQQRRTVAEIEEYFGHQERRVSKVRDFYLLSKAFSHWLECTHEERLRVLQARKKVLQMKYFSAWLELTTVNLLKIRHFQLLSALKVWHSRAGQIHSQNIEAVLYSNRNVVKEVYWRWFWTFCENRAPEWRTTRLKKRFFMRWVSRRGQILGWEQHLTHKRSYEATRQHFSLWLTRARSTEESFQAASVFNMIRTRTRAISTWQRRAQHAPLIREISRMVDWRVAGTIFATVVARCRNERQADLVKRLRIKRDAWTNWNDLLRIRILVRSIDDRVLIEALYRWVLVQRCVLLHRLYQERVMKRAFSAWRGHWSIAKGHRDSAASTVEAVRKWSCARSIMIQWRWRNELRHRDEKLAYEFCAPKIQEDTLHSWKSKIHHVQSLKGWANDADFYFLATRLIKRQWKNAMIESKRQKRRNAYGQLRRIAKVHLARRVLYSWTLGTAVIQDLKGRAHSHNEERLLRFAAGVFDTWREQTRIMTAQISQAEQHYKTLMLIQHFRAWSDGLRAQFWRVNLALVHDNMRTSDIALNCLHQLRLRMINLRGQEPNALSLRRYHERRQYYNMFRKWLDRTAKRLHRPMQGHTSAFDTTWNGRILADSHSEHDHARPEGWSIDKGEFSLSEWIPALEAQVDSVPIPGYPSTPSKRAARAKAVIEASTTPAGTPFQLRLRSQLATEPRSVRQDRMTRSGFLRDNTFAAVLEGPPRTPMS
ncbi:MAG: hypothetical protein Q9191_000954 [Dirinaria sp. TL-2023a]